MCIYAYLGGQIKYTYNTYTKEWKESAGILRAIQKLMKSA